MIAKKAEGLLAETQVLEMAHQDAAVDVEVGPHFEPTIQTHGPTHAHRADGQGSRIPGNAVIPDRKSYVARSQRLGAYDVPQAGVAMKAGRRPEETLFRLLCLSVRSHDTQQKSAK